MSFIRYDSQITASPPADNELTVDSSSIGGQQKTSSPTIMIADSSGNTFSDNPNLALQAERIKFQITLEEPEDEEDYPPTVNLHPQQKHQQQSSNQQSTNEQNKYSNPPTNYSSSTTSTTVITPPSSNITQPLTMITSVVDSNITSKSPMTASNFIVTTTASPHYQKDHPTSIHSYHSKSTCDDQDKSTSINEQETTKR